MVLLKSAWSPLAVLSLPVVLLWSAWTPMAVLSSPVVLLTERIDSGGGVFDCPWCC